MDAERPLALLLVGQPTLARQLRMGVFYVQKRLAIFDSAKHGRTGRNWLRHDRAWLERLAIYRLSKATQTVRAHASR